LWRRQAADKVPNTVPDESSDADPHGFSDAVPHYISDSVSDIVSDFFSDFISNYTSCVADACCANYIWKHGAIYSCKHSCVRYW